MGDRLSPLAVSQRSLRRISASKVIGNDGLCKHLPCVTLSYSRPEPKVEKTARNFLRHCLLIAGIHAGSFQCAKVNMMWVGAIAKCHFQGHFEGHASGQLLRCCLFLMKPVLL